jgi:acyl carrier protein
MTPHEIKNVIVSSFKEKENFRNIDLNEDYFNLGISSLTIIGLQINVEEKLGVTLGTRELMGLSTINQWIDAYTEKAASPLEHA